MGAAVSVDWSRLDADDPYFDLTRLQDKRDALSFRVPLSLKRHLQALVAVWQKRAEVHWLKELLALPEEELRELLADPKKIPPRPVIDMTFLCERLLTVGSDGAWKYAGTELGYPDLPRTERESFVAKLEQELSSLEDAAKRKGIKLPPEEKK